MCVMLRRCQRKAKGEVPMLDSFKLLPARAALADSLIVDNWIPQSHCHLEWHHLPQLRGFEGKKQGLVCTWPNFVISCQHLGVNHLGMNVCVMSNPQSWPGYMTCASCSEDVSERLRRLRVKYLCCTASSCCKLPDLADCALFQSCKAAATLQTCTCRVSIAPAALNTVVSMVNHILPWHHLPQWKQEVFCSDLAFHHIRLNLSKPCHSFSSISVEILM